MTTALIAAILILLITLAHAAHAAVPQRTHRDTVIANLRAGLAGTPMAGSEMALERVARRWGISPYFIIGVSGKESSLGAYACRRNPKNIWGLKSCRTGPYIDVDHDGDIDHLPTFRTWGHAYTWFARYVLDRQPHARTPYDFRGYCECDERQWADVVAHTMRRLFGVGPNVRYGR